MRRKILIAALILICVVLSGAMLVACNNSDAQTDPVANISLNYYPLSAVTVYQNETPDFTDCTLFVTYESGDTKVVSFNDSGVTIDGLNTAVAGEHVFTVSYGGKKIDATITVVPLVIQSIQINEAPSEIVVVEGNAFVPDGISLRVNYTNGTYVNIPKVGAEMISGYSTSFAPGTYTVYVNFHTASLPLQIEVVPKTLTAVETVYLPDDTSYFVGQTFDPSGLRVNLIYNNGTETTVDYDGNQQAFRFTLTNYMDPETHEFTGTSGGSTVQMSVRYVGANGEYADSAIGTTFPVQIWTVACKEIRLEKAPVTVGFKHLGDEYVGASPLTEAVVGDSIDWSTGSFTAINNDGTYEQGYSMDRDDVHLYVNGTAMENEVTYKDEFVFEQAGNMTIYVTYANTGSFIQLTVYVTEPDPIALEIVYLGDGELADETFYDGGTLVPDNILYNVRYNNGTTKFDFDAAGAEIPQGSRVDSSMLAAGESFRLTYRAANDPDGDGISQEKIRLIYSEYSTGDNAVEYTLVLNVRRLTVRDAEYSLPYKNVYLINSGIDLTGSSLKVELNSGAVRNYSVWNQDVLSGGSYYTAEGESAANPFGQTGEYILKIDYLGYLIEYPFSVVDAAPDEVILYRNNSPVPAGEVFTYASYAEFIASREFELRAGSVVLQWDGEGVEVRNNSGTGQRVMAFIYKGYSYALMTVNFTGNKLASLEIQTAPAKTVYHPGEGFDPEGMVLQAVSEDGSVATVFAAGNASVSYGDIPAAGSVPELYRMPVYYRGATAYVEIVVAPAGVYATGIELLAAGTAEESNYDFLVTKGETLMFYYIDDSGEVRQLQFAVTFNDGSVVEVPLSQAFVPYSADSVIPEYEVIRTEIRFNSLRSELSLYFSSRQLTGIEIAELPSRLNYVEGQQLVVEGGFLRRIYGEGSNIEYDIIPMTNGLVTLGGYRVSPFTANTVGNSMVQTIEVSYLNSRATFNVTTYRKITPTATEGADYGITLDNISMEYGNNALSPTANINITVADFVAYAPEMTIEYSVNGVWTENVPVYPGEYAVRVIVEGNECFNGAELDIPVKFERYKRLLVVTVIDNQKIYGANDPTTYEYTIDEGDLLEHDRVNLTFNRAPGEDCGSYAVTADFADGEGYQNDYYMLVSVAGELNITQRVVTNSPGMSTVRVMFDPATTTGYSNGVFTYTGNPIAGFDISYIDETGVSRQIAANDVVYCDAGGNELGYMPSEIGTYTVKISDNYDINGVTEFTFMIQKK